MVVVIEWFEAANMMMILNITAIHIFVTIAVERNE
jgi:hypothetical protein